MAMRGDVKVTARVILSEQGKLLEGLVARAYKAKDDIMAMYLKEKEEKEEAQEEAKKEREAKNSLLVLKFKKPTGTKRVALEALARRLEDARERA